MNWKAINAIALTGLVFGLASCDGENTTGSNTAYAAESATETGDKSAEGVITRAEERWGKIVGASEDESIWIEVYEYETPEFKQAVSMTQFLAKKGDFHYDQPTQPKLLLIEDETAYLDVSALWLAGRHAVVRTAEGGDVNRVEPLDMIEIWHWIDGNWHIQSPPKRKNEFFTENPDFLARAQAAANGEKKSDSEETPNK